MKFIGQKIVITTEDADGILHENLQIIAACREIEKSDGVVTEGRVVPIFF